MGIQTILLQKQCYCIAQEVNFKDIFLVIHTGNNWQQQRINEYLIIDVKTLQHALGTPVLAT